MTRRLIVIIVLATALGAPAFALVKLHRARGDAFAAADRLAAVHADAGRLHTLRATIESASIPAAESTAAAALAEAIRAAGLVRRTIRSVQPATPSDRGLRTADAALEPLTLAQLGHLLASMEPTGWRANLIEIRPLTVRARSVSGRETPSIEPAREYRVRIELVTGVAKDSV